MASLPVANARKDKSPAGGTHVPSACIAGADPHTVFRAGQPRSRTATCPWGGVEIQEQRPHGKAN